MKGCCYIISSLLIFANFVCSQTSYYVSPTGNDGNSGTTSKPFRTIQRAVDLMNPGDEVLVNPGVYRETVSSVKSGMSGKPICIKALPGGDVIITATEPVTNWAVHNGPIYKSMLNQKALQLFVFPTAMFYDFSTTPQIDPDEVMVEARFPNKNGTAKGLFEVPEDNNYTTITKSGNNFTVTGLPSGDYAQAKIYGYANKFNKRWWAGSARILSNSGNVLSGDPAFTKSFLADDNTGFVAGPLQLLDAQKEWSSDSSALYFRAPDDKDPNTLNVEAKVRGLTLRLDHDFIKVDGIKVFGGALWIAGNNNRLTNMDIRHATNPMVKKHAYNGLTKPEENPLMAVRIIGNYNTLNNSALYYSGGEGVLLKGENNLLENNTIAITSYYGHFMHSVSVLGESNTIIGNTIADGGKEHVRLYPNSTRTKVLYNNMIRNGYVAHDIGNIVAWGNNSEGTEIAYNWVHDNISSSIAENSGGIYLDNNNKDMLIHHNVVWNINGRLIHINTPQYNIHIYNNTFGNGLEDIKIGTYYNQDLGVPDILENIHIKNNYTLRPMYVTDKNSGPENTVFLSKNVQNSDVNEFSYPNFMISNSSPAADKGSFLNQVVLNGNTFPSVTNNVTDEMPDAGAYEAGGTQWRPGVNRIEDDGESVPISGIKKDSMFKDFQIFHNRTSHIVNISNPSNLMISNVKVFDLKGRQVLVENGFDNAKNIQLDVSSLSNGFYIIRIFSNNSYKHISIFLKV